MFRLVSHEEPWSAEVGQGFRLWSIGDSNPCLNVSD